MPIYLAPLSVKTLAIVLHLRPLGPSDQAIMAVTPMTTSAPKRNMMATAVAMNFHISYSFAVIVQRRISGVVAVRLWPLATSTDIRAL